MFASIISMEGVSRRPRLRVVVYAVNLRRMRRTYGARTQSASFRHGGIAWAPRVRLSVSRRTQNAPFRRVRLSSPGQTRRRLTEKRSLGRATHVKAHSARRISRKGALCMRVVTQTASFRHVARPPFWLLREKRNKSALPAEKPSCLQRDFLSFRGRLWARSWVRSARAVSRCRRNAYRSKGRPDLHCQTP